MQRREQMHLIARAQVVRGLGGLLIFGVLLLLTKRVELAALGLAVFTVPLIAASVVRVKRLGIETRPTFSRAQQRKLTLLALPLGVSVTAGALAVNVPRYFIEGVEGTAALGIFAALAYVLTLGGTIVGSLAQAASPRLANLYVSGERVQFRRTLRLLIMCGGVLGCAGVLASLVIGEVALRTVFGDEYAARNEVLVVLMVAAALQYLVAFLGTAVNAIRKFTIQMPISLVTLLTVSAAAAWGVPRFGLMGAALSVLASQIVTGLCYLWLHFSVVRPAIANSEI
jgi:O-antigen/teichoic acid export membrane protein